MGQGVFSGLISAGFSPGRNFAEFQKMRAEGVLAKFAIARLYGHLGAAVCCKMFRFVNTSSGFYLRDDGICARVFFWPSFCRTLPWPQLYRISENAR